MRGVPDAITSGMEQPFRDRREAGARLGRALRTYAGQDVIVLGLPHGGVAVAYEIAVALHARLDVLCVRKLGIPKYEEIAMGALASGGIQVVDRHIMKQLGITSAELRGVVEREKRELEQREERLRGGVHAPVDVTGRIAIVVDDGLATGSTILAAITALRVRRPEKIVIAAPVGALEVCNALRTHVDDMHVLVTPEHLESVGAWYSDFAQLGDDDVRRLLDSASFRGPHGVSTPSHHRHRNSSARRQS